MAAVTSRETLRTPSIITNFLLTFPIERNTLIPLRLKQRKQTFLKETKIMSSVLRAVVKLRHRENALL